VAKHKNVFSAQICALIGSIWLHKTPSPILAAQCKIDLVFVWDSIAKYMAVYTNGASMEINSIAPLSISALANARSYLVKSSYAVDHFGVATIDEFRMHSGAMGRT